MLLDIVHVDQNLCLVFEFLNVNLKHYMEAGNSQGTPLMCQVHIIQSLALFFFFFELVYRHRTP